MKIRDMELLVRVAESGSMTQAAQQLQLTPAAVSAAVQRIENAIGVRLFERTTRALHPTDAGVMIIDGCVDVVDRWSRALDDAQGQRSQLEGTIHLSAPADTTYQLLEGVVADVCTEHPKLRVVLDSSDSIKHLHGEAIDMAIRYGPLPESTLSARKLAETPAVLVASPAYVDAHVEPETPEDLQAHRCLTLHLSNVPRVAWVLHGHGETRTVSLDSQLCGDGYLARRWALAGMGIAFKSVFDVIDDLERGSLIRVLPGYRSEPLPIHAVFPSRRFRSTRVRVLDAAITTAFAGRATRCHDWLLANEA